ncbi:MAG: helix-turn-helix domain-containing protein [Chloroflexi bacterium]|nr:helix-turn-helix domain-containing protein [Chloroflexota bacterium]
MEHNYFSTFEFFKLLLMTSKNQNADKVLASSNGDEYLTTAQVLELLDVSRGTIYRLASEGKLKPLEFAGNKILKHKRLRFSKASVMKLMEELHYSLTESNP